jgi:release factor glutamine methyltransferase
MAKAGENSINNLLRQGREFLKDEGIRQYGWDAALLLAGVLKKEKEYVFAHSERSLPRTQVERYWRWLRQRAQRTPLQYLLKKQEFWGRDFRVNSQVLIPRPETELLVEKAIEQAQRIKGERNLTSIAIADIGTGSGCIAVTLALEIENCLVVATDISAKALQTARRNARCYGLKPSSLRFCRGNGVEPLQRKHSSVSFPLIVSNPPYVSQKEGALLDREVREFEPPLALFGGEDGLAVIRQLIPQVAKIIKPGGVFLMEFGYGQEKEIQKLFSDKSWNSVCFWPDYNGILRCVQAEKGNG